MRITFPGNIYILNIETVVISTKSALFDVMKVLILSHKECLQYLMPKELRKRIFLLDGHNFSLSSNDISLTSDDFSMSSNHFIVEHLL